jgi:carbon starvation protein
MEWILTQILFSFQTKLALIRKFKMNSLFILLITLAVFVAGYSVYGKFLNKLFQIDPNRKTPALTQFDGVDYVPAKNWLVLFGHHFSSICGAGPIVGPVLACAYWGWAPSWIWILFGVILMGAVSDYSALVLSVRSQGKGISEIANDEISPRARLLFSWFIWVSLILVIAVFAIFGAKTFIQEGSSVAPSLGLIPVAVLTGYLMYRTKLATTWATLIGLGALLALLFFGKQSPIEISTFAMLSPQNFWIVILLVYCLIASVVPVNILLQPRDYLASYLLFFTIALGATSILIMQPSMSGASFIAWRPTEWKNAGPLFPMLFVTIACGAISGFHTLVSSGTTCKQIASEGHCRRIGYGGMLTEALVGVMVIICVTTGLTQTELNSILRSGGPVAAFGEGYGNLSSFFLGDYGKSFAILALNAFILTTLDSATRIARYLTMDLFRISNKYLATGIVVVAAAALAFTGKWTLIWPAFGTANQLIAGLALLVASCWLVGRGRAALPTLIPAIIMLIVTTTAFVYQMISSLSRENPDYIIAVTCALLITLSTVVFIEAVKSLSKRRSISQ